MLQFFERIGIRAVNVAKNMHESISFSWRIIRTALSPKTYSIATVQVLVRQIYFTSVQILPFYLMLSIIVGTAIVAVTVTAAINLGMSSQIGSVIVNIIVNEMAPFITVLLLALRSGTAITTEMAVMKVSREVNTLQYFNIDPFAYLYVPRVLNGMISMVMLATLFTFVSLISGYIFLTLFLHMGLSMYIFTIVEAFGATDLLVLFIKSLMFGYVVAAIPIYRGNKTMLTYNAIPIAVLQGSVKLFVAILVIEVLSFIRFV